jgi:hypothetical protein
MKTRNNTSQAQPAESKSALRVRTQLQAGELCKVWDTSCRSPYGDNIYNSCGNKIPGAGAACIAANLASGVPYDQAECFAC